MSQVEKENRLLILDIKNKFFWALWVRYILIGLGFLLIYLSVLTEAYLPRALKLTFFLLAYNLVAHVFCLIKKNYQLWEITALGFIFQLFDVLTITYVIYITGWVDSPYWFLYLALMILYGFGMFSYFSISVFVIAFFSAIFYIGLLWVAYLGWLPVYGPGFKLSQQQLLGLISNKAVFTVVSLLMFSTILYYFSRLLNQQREELSQKNRQLLAALVKIKDVDRLKDEFVSTTSHELRTPLSVVRENLSLIEDGVVGEVNPKQKQLLEVSRSNIDRLAVILDDLLDISKIESHSLDLHRKRVNLAQVALLALDLLKSKAERKKLTIEKKMTGRVVAQLDDTQIIRIFINLIDNAIKFTPNQGKIIIEIAANNNEVICSVSDNGVGIDRADLPRVFERFVHLRERSGENIKGVGLGLSICKAIVEMHGGRITVESPPPGSSQGSRFTFILPKVES